MSGRTAAAAVVCKGRGKLELRDLDDPRCRATDDLLRCPSWQLAALEDQADGAQRLAVCREVAREHVGRQDVRGVRRRVAQSVRENDVRE